MAFYNNSANYSYIADDRHAKIEVTLRYVMTAMLIKYQLCFNFYRNKSTNEVYLLVMLIKKG